MVSGDHCVRFLAAIAELVSEFMSITVSLSQLPKLLGLVASFQRQDFLSTRLISNSISVETRTSSWVLQHQWKNNQSICVWFYFARGLSQFYHSNLHVTTGGFPSEKLQLRQRFVKIDTAANDGKRTGHLFILCKMWKPSVSPTTCQNNYCKIVSSKHKHSKVFRNVGNFPKCQYRHRGRL